MTPAIVAVTPPETSKTVLALLPSIVSMRGLGPSMSRFVSIFNGPFVSVIAPTTVGAKLMMVLPPCALLMA